jgi:glucan phosphoethanolaminetransferase (alkaline phosphatase superfamily)
MLITTVLAPAVLMSLALYALSPRLSIWLFCFAIPLAIMEVLYVVRYERVTDEHVFAVATETNFQESIGWLGPAGLLLVFAGLLAMAGGAVFVWKYSATLPRLPTRWRAILVLAGLAVFGMIKAPDLVALDPTLEDGTLNTLAHADASDQLSTQLTGQFHQTQLNDLFPWGLPLRIHRYLDLQAGMKNARHALADFRFGAHQASARASDEEIFILLIGETGRADRWQLNGYDRATNPRLSQQDGLISFTNAITGWAWTRMSVPVILSRKPSALALSFFPERSIVSAFQEAGFWTAWYSMHGPLGFHESAVALYASEANDVRYLNPAGYRSPGAYDEALLAPLDDALRRSDAKKFIVLHTMGSHYNYAHRVPPAFEVFSPSLRDRRDADLHNRAQREELNNSYDNSIRYTDHVLAEVIQRLAKTGQVATLLYVADHGENLFDGECDKAGHGHNTEYDYRIAALWWNSEAFAQRYPENVALLSSRRHLPWTTESVFNTLLDVAGIATSIPTRGGQSLLQPTFASQPRWIQSGGDFDTAEPEGACGVLKIIKTPATNKPIQREQK